MNKKEAMSYAKAGVDRNAEEESVASILNIIKSTYQGSTIPDGHFAGSIPYGDDLLSLATDGVGSKVILAQELNKYDTIGIDCVAMNVNDLLAIGSIPVAFVDYIAIRSPDKKVLSEIVKGLADGCIESEIPLIGGETAILPEIITPVNEKQGFDVAGTALGIHNKDRSITGEKIAPGDVIIGVSSSGIHSNGLTLARKLIKEKSLKEELLIPTRIYVKMVKSLLDQYLDEIHGMAHITGGGFTNLLRLGEHHYDLEIDLDQVPPIFKVIQANGNVADEEMFRTFNMGVGFVIVVSSKAPVIEILDLIRTYYPASIIGSISIGNKVSINNNIAFY